MKEEKIRIIAGKEIAKKIVNIELLNNNINAETAEKKDIINFLINKMVVNNEIVIDEFIIDDVEDEFNKNEKRLSAICYAITKKSYDYEKILNNLPDDKIDKIIDIEYDVNEIELNIALADPHYKSIVEKIITKRKVVNDKKLEFAFDIGDIQICDIKDCIIENKNISLKVQRKKKECMNLQES